MAEGGGDFGYDDPDLDQKLDHDNDDSDQEVDTTRPFQPTEASTPYNLGEQHEMQTMHNEQSGLPDTSYEEKPLLSDFISPQEKQGMIDRSLDFIKKRFPEVDFSKLDPIGFSKKGAKTEIVSFGLRGGKTPIFKKDGSGLLKSFTDKFSKSLGPSAEKIIAEDRDSIKEQRQILEASQKQLRDAEALKIEKDNEIEEI